MKTIRAFGKKWKELLTIDIIIMIYHFYIRVQYEICRHILQKKKKNKYSKQV